MTPIFKSGDKEDLNNYRPISVLPTVARIFEKLLYEQLHKYFTDNEILGKTQWGFRSLHSAALALNNCTSDWLLNIDRGNVNTVVFLDIKKAFDTIDHPILLNKLEKYGICCKELLFFKSYLTNRKQYCSIQNRNSSFKPVLTGVPQGSILRPLLFIIYMNDLPNCVQDAKVTMYADDTSVGNTSRRISDIKTNLIPDLLSVCDWLKANKLSLNTIKTELMFIGTTQNITKINNLIAVRVDGKLIKRAKKVKYLGLVIDENMKWDEHVVYISSKIRRNLGVMKRLSNDIPLDSLVTLYLTLIEPYFRYCNTVWGNCEQGLLNKLQTLQNRAARIVTRTRYSDADHETILKKLEWLNVRQLAAYETLVIMYKVDNNLVPETMTDMFQLTAEVHNYSTRSTTARNYYVHNANLMKTRKAVTYAGSVAWNKLPHAIKEAQSLNVFKARLKVYLLENNEAQFTFNWTFIFLSF